MAWDVLSASAKMAWDVMSGVTKTAWDVLSGVANRCGMFCPGCKKWHGMFCPRMFCPTFGNPCPFFSVSFSSKLCLGEPCSNLFRVGVHSHFKQLITNLSLHYAFKMSGCQSFSGFMYLLKNSTTKI